MGYTYNLGKRARNDVARMSRTAYVLTHKHLTRRNPNRRARARYLPTRGLAANVVGMIRRGSVAHAAGAVNADTVEHSSVEAGLEGACLRRAWCTKRDPSKPYFSRRQLATRWCHNCGGVIVHASLTDEHRRLPVDCSSNVDTFLPKRFVPNRMRSASVSTDSLQSGKWSKNS